MAGQGCYCHRRHGDGKEDLHPDRPEIRAQPRSAAAVSTTVAIATTRATVHANTISQPNVCGADAGNAFVTVIAWSAATCGRGSVRPLVAGSFLAAAWGLGADVA